MTPLLELERFDSGRAGQVPRDPTSSRPPSYEDGYAAGSAATKMTLEQEQDALRAEMVAAVSACVQTQDEARQALIASLRPLHDAILNTLLPQLLAPALYAHLRDMIETALAQDLEQPVELAVAPENCGAVAAAFQDILGQKLVVIEDGSLGPHAAMLRFSGLETALDLDAALATIVDHMDALDKLTSDHAEAS